MGNGEKEEEESRGQSSICRQCPVSREKKFDFIVGFIHHRYITPRKSVWSIYWLGISSGTSKQP